MTTPEPGDGYDALAEFHDLFMDEPWERLRPHLRAAFGELTPDAVVVEIGAGTGMGISMLAEETGAELVALEPNRTMRTMLTLRVAADADLVERVTVVAGGAPVALDGFDPPIAGFVCAHMLGHLDAAARGATLARLAALLSPTGTGVVTLDAGGPPLTEPVVESRRVGRYRYEARHLPTSTDDAHASEYLVYDGDEVVRRERFGGTWQRVPTPQLAAELASVGLTLTPVEPTVGLVRRAYPAGS